MSAKVDPATVEQTLDSNDDDAAANEAVANARALALRDSMIPRLHTGEPAYKQFTKEMLSLVAKTIMPPNYSLPELYMGLEIAATYGLDPFTKELWLVRMKESGPVTPLVGRDGLLAIAERHRGYRGFRNADVYEKDEFEILADPREMPDGTYSHIRHVVKGFGDRGQLLGAWAEVYRDGRPPVHFEAYLENYDRGGNTPWSKQKPAMIRKVALANALRLAFRISGLYVGDEQSGASIEMTTARETTASGEPAPLHEHPEWAARFEQLFRARNDITPGAYLPAKQKLLVAGCTDEEKLAELEQQLENEIVEAGGAVPLRPEAGGDEVIEPTAGEIEEPVAEQQQIV